MAIWEVMESRSQLIAHNPPGPDMLQAIAVGLPAKEQELSDLRAAVTRDLDYSRFFEQFPNATVTLTAARLPGAYRVARSGTPDWKARIVRTLWRLVNKGFTGIFGKNQVALYLWVTRLYSFHNPIPTVQTIMQSATTRVTRKEVNGGAFEYYVLNGSCDTGEGTPTSPALASNLRESPFPSNN